MRMPITTPSGNPSTLERGPARADQRRRAKAGGSQTAVGPERGPATLNGTVSGEMVELTIAMKRKTDGTTTLSCRRRDGSVTWQHHNLGQGAFFPLHDLTHYAVETVLGHHAGFYGLVADGWNVTDFGAPWPRGPLPPEALTAELIVGFLDAERAAGVRWSAADFDAHRAAFAAQRGVAIEYTLTDDALARIRAVRSELFERWAALPAGHTMTLAFSREPTD